MRNGELREALCKHSAWTHRLLAIKFTNVQQKHDRLPIYWPVADDSSIATVNMTGRALTHWAGCCASRAFAFERNGRFIDRYLEKAKIL